MFALQQHWFRSRHHTTSYQPPIPIITFTQPNNTSLCWLQPHQEHIFFNQIQTTTTQVTQITSKTKQTNPLHFSNSHNNQNNSLLFYNSSPKTTINHVSFQRSLCPTITISTTSLLLWPRLPNSSFSLLSPSSKNTPLLSPFSPYITQISPSYLQTTNHIEISTKNKLTHLLFFSQFSLHPFSLSLYKSNQYIRISN